MIVLRVMQTMEAQLNRTIPVTFWQKKKKDVAFSVWPKTKNFHKFKRKRLMPLAIEIPTQPNIDSVAKSLVIALIQADSE